MEWENDEYTISDCSELIDIEVVLNLLGNVYWAKNRTRELIEKSIEESLCFGVYHIDKQVGFARIVTDNSTFSWICDIIIDDEHRGKGLGKKLVEVIVDHPDIKNTKMFLATKDAHGLYEKYGFKKTEAMVKRQRK